MFREAPETMGRPRFRQSVERACRAAALRRRVERRTLKSSMPGIVVKPRARILHGHDWVFSSEVLKVFGKPSDGDVISLKDGKDRLIGSAIYNSKSQIVGRRFSRRKQELDLDFFKRRIAQATEYRTRRGVDPKLCRVVWSESDGLPGLIIDRYGDHFVMQTLTLAMDMRKDLIANAVIDLFGNATIIERNDAPVRKAESSKSIFCMDKRPVFISIKNTITRSSPNSRLADACWIVSPIREHLR